MEKYVLGKRVIYSSNSHSLFLKSVERDYIRCDLSEFNWGCWQLANCKKSLPLFARMILFEQTHSCQACQALVPVPDGWGMNDEILCEECFCDAVNPPN